MHMHETLSISQPEMTRDFPFRATFGCFERIKQGRLAEYKSDASDLDEKAAEYNDDETDSEVDVEGNLVHDEDSELKFRYKRCASSIHSNSILIIP
ncbi:hypothetical protein AVEN_141814-1 [Araneus ventricosus]|uniref:Uncharacterized protein n=1 Tax=Araneus ventricosus TaxID=182803 RepID=A0A4Y2E753_ARAVE|nr:hypothetical protein AVEN_141814-1 [Araneus ventricosus]